MVLPRVLPPSIAARGRRALVLEGADDLGAGLTWAARTMPPRKNASHHVGGSHRSHGVLLALVRAVTESAADWGMRRSPRPQRALLPHGPRHLSGGLTFIVGNNIEPPQAWGIIG